MTEVLGAPIKSPSDKNNYRLIKLQNGMKVLLVQHSREAFEKLAGLCLFVDVGGYDDESFRGLSHFLKHMLLQDKVFADFCSTYGGSFGSESAFKETKYYFSISENYLENAIEGFAATILEPLLSENYIESVINVVISEEHASKISNVEKFEVVLKTFLTDKHIANVCVECNPKEKEDGTILSDSELIAVLREFYEKHYVANRMNLVLTSERDLDALQNIVESHFTDVESGSAREEHQIDAYENAIDRTLFNEIIHVKPVMNNRMIFLTWYLPPSFKYYKCKPLSYITHLINNRSSGGLQSYLRKNSLAYTVNAYETTSFGTLALFTDFNIEVHMTENGVKNVEEILKAIYSYLFLIKETDMEKHKEIYSNYQSIEENNYNFNEKDVGVDGTAILLAESMHIYENADILRGGSLFQEFDEEAIKFHVNLLNEPNFVVTLRDYESKIPYDKKEKRFGIEYKVELRSEAMQRLWNERGILEDLSLPPKNEYICTNFEIKSDEENFIPMEFPEQIFLSNIAETWFKSDSTYKKPIGLIEIYLDSPFNYSSAFNIVLSEIYVSFVNSYLEEELSSAIEANFSASLDLVKQSIRIKIRGFNEKLMAVTNIATKSLKNFNNFLTESNFNLYRESIKKSLLEAMKGGNDAHFDEILTNFILLEKDTLAYEKYIALDQITFEHMKMFVDKCFKTMKIGIFVQGNLYRDEALLISKAILFNLECQEVADLSSIESETLKIPIGRSSIKVKSSLSNNASSSICMDYFDCGERSLRKECLLDILIAILKEPLNDLISSQDQWSSDIELIKTKNSLGFKIKIYFQEEKVSAKAVALRMKKFIEDEAKEILDNLTVEKFDSIIDTQLGYRRINFANLLQEFEFNIDQIRRKLNMFDQPGKELQMFLRISKHDVMDFYNKYVQSAESRVLNLMFLASTEESSNMKIKYATEQFVENENVVSDLQEFKRGFEKY